MLESSSDIASLTASAIMTSSPKTIREDEMATTALKQMQNNNITQLIVANGDKYIGVIHLHDLLKEGIV